MSLDTPSLLYLPKESEFSTGTIAVVSRRTDTSAAALTVTGSLYTVPGDRVFLLDHISLTSLAGAAQLTDQVAVILSDELGAASQGSVINVANIAAQRFATSINNVSLILMPRTSISYTVTYNLGGAINAVSAIIRGRSIPRANIQSG